VKVPAIRGLPNSIRSIDMTTQVLYCHVMAKETVIQVRCSSTEKEQWRALAKTKGTVLSEYVRALLNAMVEKNG
jgi:hypothetical protein